MKFNEYLDVIYVNKNLGLQKQFNLRDQAITRAIPDLINSVRTFFVWVAYFQLIWGFWKSKLTDSWPIQEHLKLKKTAKELDQESKDKACQDVEGVPA